VKEVVKEKGELKEFIKEKDRPEGLPSTQFKVKEVVKEKGEVKEFIKEMDKFEKEKPENEQGEQLPTVPAVSPKNFEKVAKLEKYEKLEFEKYGLEKAQFDGKDLVEGGIPVQPGVDPGLAQRVATLESVVTQLTHFIPENLRPDLSKGALKQEPDISPPSAKPKTTANTGAAKE
jgi:hypothetical protein